MLALVAGCALRHTLHYEPVAFELPPVEASQLDGLAERIERDTGRRRLRSWALGPPDAPFQGPMRAADLPVEVLYALYAYSRPWTRGGELDLLVDVGQGPVPVTLWWTPRREVAFDYGTLQPHRARPTGLFGVALEEALDARALARWMDELSVRYGLGAFRGELWTEDEVGDVATALEHLSEVELLALAGIALVRTDVSPRSARRELAYFDPATEPPTLTFFDLAFENDLHGFVGPVGAPLAAGTMTAMHEFGHALADLPSRQAFTQYVAAAEAWERGEGERTLARERYRDYQALGRQGPVIDAWEAFRDGRFGPSSYGFRDPHESFAEAFALYHLDPDALERALPGAVAWFDAGVHLAAAGLLEAEPLDAPGEE